AERAADLDAVEQDRSVNAARAADLHERFLELDRRREGAERRAADVLGAVADARDLVRRRLVQLDGVDARLAVLASRLDEDQLVAEARALRAQWSELGDALDRLEPAPSPPPPASEIAASGSSSTSATRTSPRSGRRLSR